MIKRIFINILMISLFSFTFKTGITFPAPKFDLTKYHDYNEMTKMLKDFQSKNSHLARLISAGKSFQDKDLWVMEITNRTIGSPEEKAAIFIGGGLRGDEVVGTEVCLYTIQYLLENYNQNDRIKALIDEKTFYIWPAINPDACNLSVKNPGKTMIKNFRPVDEDFDGKVDEDPAEDLNNDGFISMMRVKDEKGDFKIYADDPRIMIHVDKKKGEQGEYKLYTEGTDNDEDEKYNEDGIGGVNLNLNFPSGWKMEYEQPGSGMYPGSEPESEAVMRFLIDHPNTAAIIVYQSGEGALYRPFYHLADKEIPKLDLKIYEMMGQKYKKITGYEMTHGFQEDEKKEKNKTGPDEEAKLLAELERELPAEMKVEDILKMGNIREWVKSTEAQTYIQQYGISDATIKKMMRLPELRLKSKAETTETKKAKLIKKEPANFGALIDWAYKDYNVYSLSPSVWSVPDEYQVKADSIPTQIQDELSWLNFNEKEQNGKGFRAWQKYKHPQLGEMEIGGWCSFYKKNPPLGKRLEEVCKQNALFSFDLAELTPQVKIKEIEIKPIQIVKGVTDAKASVAKDGTIQISPGDKKIADSAILAEIKIKVENVGDVGTRTALGKKTRYSQQPPRSVLAYVEAGDKNMEILSMPKVLRLGVIEGTETKNLVEEEKKKQIEQPPSPGMMMEERQEVEETEEKESSEPNIKSGSWLVKIDGNSAELIFKVVSEKGGIVVKKVPVKL